MQLISHEGGSGKGYFYPVPQIVRHVTLFPLFFPSLFLRPSLIHFVDSLFFPPISFLSQEHSKVICFSFHRCYIRYTFCCFLIQDLTWSTWPAEVQTEYQNVARKVIKVTLNVAWLLVPDELIWVFQKLLFAIFAHDYLWGLQRMIWKGVLCENDLLMSDENSQTFLSW